MQPDETPTQNGDSHNSRPQSAPPSTEQTQRSGSGSGSRGLFKAADFPPVPEWARRPPGGGQAGLFDGSDDD